MAEKLYEYQGCIGILHQIRDGFREKYQIWKENNPNGIRSWLKNLLFKESCNNVQSLEHEDFSHVYRRKTRKELVRISAVVMGIEFSYAAETAFVSPTLLKIGIEHEHMTLVWALSPLIGFFLTPILGSLSDRCHLSYGRRRPFVLVMSIGILLGLILVPNGEFLGYVMGDTRPSHLKYYRMGSYRTSAGNIENSDKYNSTESILFENGDNAVPYNNSHPWGVFFTILGTVLLDFDADACQGPARAYLLDITVSDDHARGLSTFTIMAGLGGFLGYALGGINWDVTFIGAIMGGHVRAVFTLITIIFIICVIYTITSFIEVPLSLLELSNSQNIHYETEAGEAFEITEVGSQSYGTLEESEVLQQESSQYLANTGNGKRSLVPRKSLIPDSNASLLLYLKSIVYMPHSIKMLCVTNLFCWMAHVCYSLYFTDFVGEAVFLGDPTAIEGSASRELYEAGVRFGCWGMSMYSLSCACYSMKIENFILKYGAKRVYVSGLLIYSSGMFLMAFTKHEVGVIVFSGTAGVLYSTLFTMPYLIVAHYHAKGTFEITQDGEEKVSHQIRGVGTDVAIVSSMVFLAQFILSICMGTIVSITGTTTAVVGVASALAFCGALSATQIMYLDL